MSPAEPKVWLKYETEKNGKQYKISIRKVTPDLYDAVVDHMVTFYLTGEKKAKALNFVDDEESVQSMRSVWKEVLKQGNGLVAILEDDKDAPPHCIIGANITYLKEKGNELDFAKYKGEKYSIYMKSSLSMYTSVDLYSMFGVTKILSALGLSVNPAYSGLHLGQRILETREQLCKALGAKVTVTIFSAIHVPEKSGFQTIKEWECSAYTLDGRVCFPNSTGKVALMAKVFDD